MALINKLFATASISTLTTKNTVEEKQLPTITLQDRLRNYRSQVLAYSDAANPPKLVASGEYRNGFFNAIEQAYSRHYHLVLRPDDLWLTIAQGISAHINYKDNAELYRDKFVTHQGKEDVVIIVNKNHFNWTTCVDLLIKELSPRVRAEIDKIMVCDFSTTTEVIKTASQVVLMDVLQKYFNYAILSMCGIPRVTLLGTLADWKAVQEKVDAIVALGIGLDGWLVQFVTPIVQQFIRTYQQEEPIDEGFWSTVWGEKKYMSGKGETVSGWLGHLYPYTNKGTPTNLITAQKDGYCHRIPTAEIPIGTASVPFVLVDVDKDYKYDLNFEAGFFGVRQVKLEEFVAEMKGSQEGQEWCVSPYVGWAVKADKKLQIPKDLLVTFK